MLALQSALFSHVTRGEVVVGVFLSAATFVLSTTVMFAVLVTLPHDYFAGEAPPTRTTPGRRGLLAWPFRIAKNAGGVALVLLGLAMALPGVPGQGVLTIFTGLLLVDFPGHYGLLRRIVRRPSIRGGIDRVRKRFGKQALLVAPDP
jgi:hypothetical protein